MKILMSGASGLIGSALRAQLLAAGHEVVTMMRGDPAPGGPHDNASVWWNPIEGRIDRLAFDRLGPFDAVVHLAGAGIADRRWTSARRREIRASRIDSTELLSREIARLDEPPSVFVSASAIGFYGDRGSERLVEGSSPGEGFLAEVCVEWEEATAPAAAAGVRVVNLRSGIVLSAEGGALAQQIRIFRFGLGGRLGGGRQYMSWISLDDEVGVIRKAIDDVTLVGALNATAPEPVTNAAFTKALGAILGRPTLWVVPRPALVLLLGADLADEMLLASQRVLPEKLTEAGYQFAHPDLESALRSIINGH
jgi:uncharacterized protein (TIGR01777 family)